MRPISLTIDGFTSFKKETHIPFQGMEVFAITGENGAGKSSILEAMLFALYGKTARLGNEKKDLISLGRDRLAVSLEFETAGKIYRVTRSFKTKGNPFIKLETLQKDSWKEVSHGRAVVEKEIERILRMPYEAFTKAVLIPQGNFDAFLKPNTPKERREVLMELFDLHIYERMRKRAKQIRSETEGRREEMEHQLSTRFENATEKELKIAEKEQQALQTKSTSLQEQQEQSKKEWAHRKAIMEFIDEFHETKEKLKSLESTLREHGSQRKTAEKDHSLSREAMASIPNLEIKKTELSQSAERLQEILKKELLLKECESSLQESISASQQIDQRMKALQKEKENLDSEMKKVRLEANGTGFNQEYMDDLLALYGDARELATQRTAISRLEKGIEEESTKIQRFEKQVETLGQALTELNSKVSQKKSESDAAEKELEALLLKRRLQPGDPCPVCGSILKAPPTVSEEKISKARAAFHAAKDELQTLEKDQLSTQKDDASLRAEWNQAKQVLSQKNSDFRKTEKQLLTGESFLREKAKVPENTYPETYVTQQFETQKKLQETFRKIQTHLQDLEQTVHQKEKDILNLHSDWKLKNAELQDRKNRCTALQEEIDHLKQKVQHHLKVKKDLDHVLISIQQDQHQIEAKISEIRENARLTEMRLVKFQEAEAYVAEQVETKRASYENLLPRFEGLSSKERKYSEADLKALEEKMSLRSRELQERAHALGAIQTRIESIRENIKKAKQLQKEARKLNEKAVLYKTLSQQLGSKALQEFVVATILAKLIEAANNYLSDLTQGRYGLDQEEENIVVKDSWSGGEARITQTLSGGESFVVSLSLAMALTEFVGGAHLGSLFLDEGFGSLDREKLDLVYEALGKVTGSGKLIAVVTHVEELANRFPIRLHVTNEPSGSKVDFLYPEATF